LENAVKAAKAVKGKEKPSSGREVNQANVKFPIKTDPLEVSPEEKVSVALDANKAAWTNDKIKSAITRLSVSKDYRLFMSSEGGKVSVETAMTGLAHESIAKANGVMERVPYQESMCGGFEFIKSKDWNTFPEVVGLLLHEAFGHASEGDLVYTQESVLYGNIGSQVASNLITIIDEGIVEGGYFYPFDDEGTKKGKTVIVENGVLKNFLQSTTSAARFNTKSTGNGRAQDFENLPIVRQTNYYMQPKDQEFNAPQEDKLRLEWEHSPSALDRRKL